MRTGLKVSLALLGAGASGVLGIAYHNYRVSVPKIQPSIPLSIAPKPVVPISDSPVNATDNPFPFAWLLPLWRSSRPAPVVQISPGRQGTPTASAPVRAAQPPSTAPVRVASPPAAFGGGGRVGR